MLKILDSVQTAVVELGIARPKLIMIGALIATVVLIGALVLRVEVDTDPENMLSESNDVRVLNRSIAEEFGTKNMLVLGVVEKGGALNAVTLRDAARLVSDIKDLDKIKPEGVISFTSVIPVPEGDLSEDDVTRISDALTGDPVLGIRVLSADRTGLAVYIPLEEKGDVNGVTSEVRDLLKVHNLDADGGHYLAGLPLAEEKFGRDMFIQMALLAPLAGMLIFMLMLYFFRKLILVVAAMLVAMLSVIWTMGLLTGTGFTLHIMSSMIPIFLMPIAVLDSIHILSEFFEKYPDTRERKSTLRAIYHELATPISFTSLTTAVAFASLALAPIPPVQVFGLFVAFGVLAAWLLTMLFLPAFIMLLSEEGLQKSIKGNEESGSTVITEGLRGLGHFAVGKPWVFPALFIALAIAAVPGMMKVEVNDNPVRWFKSGSEIRVAIEEFNRLFPGVYNASLVVDADVPGTLTTPEMLSRLVGLEEHLTGISFVGQVTSHADLVTAGGGAEAIPETQAEIEASLDEVFDSSQGVIAGGLISADFQRANVQILMKQGDNKSMQEVLDAADAYLAGAPFPSGSSDNWAGETYLNLVWQDKMVSGMLKAFVSTFIVVFVLMVILFRSLRWAVLAILPLSATILLVYGVIGFSGKDYDMPIAVLSTLVLGVAIDFAIHFIQRYRQLSEEEGGSIGLALGRVYEEPARAITKNALIVALGFVPMFIASLTPYIVVGVFMASIMVLRRVVSL
ncbi:MAG: MMPL family transporter, partial [Chloroflexi bacterium]|nr:MMPL family transporter [Chloroflexota bacterium]